MANVLGVKKSFFSKNVPPKSNYVNILLLHCAECFPNDCCVVDGIKVINIKYYKQQVYAPASSCATQPWSLHGTAPLMQAVTPLPMGIYSKSLIQLFIVLRIYNFGLDPNLLDITKMPVNQGGRGTRYNLMKWHISSWLFTKLDDFLPFFIYDVMCRNKQM